MRIYVNYLCKVYSYWNLNLMARGKTRIRLGNQGLYSGHCKGLKSRISCSLDEVCDWVYV